MISKLLKFKERKSKAFTLIELLAIIVILAVILVIIVPQVFSFLEDSKKSSLQESASGFAKWYDKANSLDELVKMNDKIITDTNSNYEMTDNWECISETTAIGAEVSLNDYNINVNLPSGISNMTVADVKRNNLIEKNTCSMIRKNESNTYDVIMVAKENGKLYFGDDAVWASNEEFNSWKVVNFCKEMVATGNYSNGQVVTYNGDKWYVIKDNGESVTLVLASNYGTGAYGSLTWGSSTAHTKVNEYLTNEEVDTGCLINDETYGYARIPFKSELNANIPNDSNTEFWTSTVASSKLYIGGANGQVVKGNVVTQEPRIVMPVKLLGSYYSGGPHNTGFVWEYMTVTGYQNQELLIGPSVTYLSLVNPVSAGTLYVSTGARLLTEEEDIIDCYDSSRTNWSYSWYTSAYSNATEDRVSYSVCTDYGQKTVYLCKELSCCKYGSKNSYKSGGSTHYSLKDIEIYTSTACTSANKYNTYIQNFTMGYRPVITVKKG